MKFKVDENPPKEYVSILREAGFEADSVPDEKLSGAGDSVLSERCRTEDRVLMTLDLDFANVQAYLHGTTTHSNCRSRSSRRQIE